MVFSSPLFLFLFLPVVLTVYYLLPTLRTRNGWLLLVSLLFYAWGKSGSFCSCWFPRWPISSWANGWNAAKKIAGRKIAVAVAVVVNVGFPRLFQIRGPGGGVAERAAEIIRPGRAARCRIWRCPSAFPFSPSTPCPTSLTFTAANRGRPATRATRRSTFSFSRNWWPGRFCAGTPSRRSWSARPSTAPCSPRASAGSSADLAKKTIIANAVAVPADQIFSLPAGRTFRAGRLARRGVLHPANLFRFFRLLGHGGGPGQNVRLPIPRKFQFPLHRAIHPRFLAALAHFAVHLVPRLRLYSAGRQPRFRGAQPFQPGGGVFSLRLVARRQLDLRGLGAVPWHLSGAGTDGLGRRVDSCPVRCGISTPC